MPTASSSLQVLECPTCFESIGLRPEVYKRLRNTGKTFTCPCCRKRIVFAEPLEVRYESAQERIAELERENTRLLARVDQLEMAVND